MRFKGREVTDVEVEDVDPKDYPDFCDAFIASARWGDTGEDLTEAELNALNEDGDFVYDAVCKQVF